MNANPTYAIFFFEQESAISYTIFHITNYIKKWIPTSAFSFQFQIRLAVDVALVEQIFNILNMNIFVSYFRHKVKLNIENLFSLLDSSTFFFNLFSLFFYWKTFVVDFCTKHLFSKINKHGWLSWAGFNLVNRPH